MPFDLADIDDMFDDQLIYPATFVSKAGRTTDIGVIFISEYSPTFVGETGFSNDNPVALCKKNDVWDASKGSTLTLHDYIEDEIGERITDPSGDDIIGTNIAKYNVTEVHKDADGFIELQLSLN
jgi:hypothetical protein